MKKLYIYIAALFIIPTVIFITHAAAEDAAANRTNTEFLNSLGWEISECIETADVKIPSEFDSVYKNYNALQIRSGFDLERYKGVDAKRYTYLILNYPGYGSEEIRANILVFNGKIIGGDIMTVKIDGFMTELKPRES